MNDSRMISSAQHPLVKHLVQLRTEAAYRYEHRTVVIEGLKPVQETPGIIKLLYTADYAKEAASFSAEKWQISEAILHKISGMVSPEGIMAEVSMPPFSMLYEDTHVLALDGVSDPGNMGALMRTALALGWKTIYFLPGCCDPFNEKVLRAARGSHFKLSLVKGPMSHLQDWVKNNHIQAFVADLEGISPGNISPSSRRLLVFGNEAHGPSPSAHEFCQRVSIPMAGDMESLNVTVAGGILMYLLSISRL